MDDPTPTKRRRLLEGISVGGATLLAGCTDQLDLGGDGGSDEQVDSGSDAGADGVAAIAAIDQEAIQEEQARLRSELQSGNISQQEAQEELATLQQEYLDEAVTALGDTAAEAEGVTVEAEYRSLGAVVVTGDAGGILGILNTDAVRALVPRSDVEERAQSAQGTGTAQN
ncbi:hypothetical protein [Halobellus limi]|uniref:Uncharacterized protein n=1 Tax=Halobellus limi TaxID=699433 RepID=A0A1H5Z3G8_9EURY|nr:hypothetical protein [Halobellus limi]QCC48230.1 hypothetical protein DV707_11450 [Halobellus limi]SEG31119.1 hypothetical protein SAMN04488133_1842 [Halobellus limi]